MFTVMILPFWDHVTFNLLREFSMDSQSIKTLHDYVDIAQRILWATYATAMQTAF